MAYFDVFNGDADGLCALVQLRLAEPVASSLITGVKRDIQLLSQVQAEAGDTVTVLDISMDKNKQALEQVLAAGASVFYCDHHVSGDIPSSENLHALINLEPNVCTSLLVNGHLEGRYALWAIVGAFGDNLQDSARAVAKPLQLSEEELQLLEQLGICINYNGYGAAEEDLHFSPRDLYRELVKFDTPFDFIENNAAVFQKLANGYRDDMAKAAALKPMFAQSHAAVFVLPNEKWARRVSGVYSNDLANDFPKRAHAVLTEKENGNYLVSVRAPLSNKQGAADICGQFATGGGRAAAAGINDLAAADVDNFIRVFADYYA